MLNVTRVKPISAPLNHFLIITLQTLHAAFRDHFYDNNIFCKKSASTVISNLPHF